MAGEKAYVSIWKTSQRGQGKGHLSDGYPASDFPGEPGSRPDGCAYFAKDRWIAEEFAKPSMGGYEDFIVEVRIPVNVYQNRYQRFEHPVVFGDKRGVELAVRSDQLDELNRVGVRLRAEQTAK